MRWKAGVRTCAIASLLFTGCNRHLFEATGNVSSDGGGMGTWTKTPEACSRDPFDARPVETTNSIASFFWEDPAGKDERLRRNFGRDAPDVPFRLDFMRDGDRLAARLQTVKTPGRLIKSADCLVLRVDTHDDPPLYPNGRPPMAGHITMNCRANGSHITADFTFQRCEY